MKTKAVAVTTPEAIAPLDPEVMELALINQDLSAMHPSERLHYYRSVCESLGLNPLTQPFAYITLNGKMKLYALKDCTEQLRKIHDISLAIISRELTEGVYVVTAQATNGKGRKDESIGAVSVESLKGEAKANALMKTETKAKRRVTLSICGLGMLDETEADTIPGAVTVTAEQQAKENIEKAIAAREPLSIGENTSQPSGQPAESPDWRDLVCHVGLANGPLLGKTLGEIARQPRLIDYLNAKWRHKLKSPTPEDSILLDAVAQACAEGADREPPAPEDNIPMQPDLGPAEPGKPKEQPPVSPKTSTLPKPPKEKIAWRTVKIHLKGKAEGKTLEDMLNMSPKHLAAVGPLIEARMDKNPENRSLLDKILTNAYEEALKETGVAMDEKKLREELLERIKDLVITTEHFDNLLIEAGAFEKGQSIRKVDEAALRYLVANWKTIEEAVKQSLKG